MTWKRTLLLAAAVMLSAAAIMAQGITARVVGSVKDASGGVVPGVTVVATNQATTVAYQAVSDDAGRYVISLLPPGTYSVAAELSGFKKYLREGVKLEIEQTASIDVTLEVGSPNEVVAVTAAATALLTTAQAHLDQTIENKMVADLPLQERNVFKFVTLVPGIVTQNNVGSVGNRNFFDSNFAINGGRASTNDILLDGVANTIGDANGVAVVPPLDAVDEFKIMSGAYSAEFGRSGGGVVNIVTKGGGNQLHGSIYEFHQNSVLNANGWTRNRSRLARESNRRNHFGGALSGPVLIPKLYDGRKKTFFFFDYEGRRERLPASFLTTVPTAEQRAGDFSKTTTRTGQRITIYNPWTTRPNPAGAGYIRDPFPDNKIPLNQTNPATGRPFGDPVALKILSYFPQPNRAPEFADGANNYVFSGTNRLDKDLWDFRIDHNVSDKQRFFAKYTYEDRFDDPANNFGSGPESVAANVRPIRDRFTNAVFDHTYYFTPTLINNLRYGYSRAHANQFPVGFGFDVTTLGFPSQLRDLATVRYFPSVAVGGNIGYTALGAQGFNDQPRDTTTIAESLTKILGRHTVKSGFEWRLIRFHAFQVINSSGQYSFNDAYTRGPNPDAASATAGLGIASMLLGTPAGGGFEFGTPLTVYHHYAAAYVQDDWRITDRLTLNLGLRWDIETGTAERYGRMTYFERDKPSPLAGKVPGMPNLNGLLNFTGEGNPTAAWDAATTRFAPRVGAAYRLNDKTTLRAGYGIFFLPLSVEAFAALGYNFTTPLAQPDPRVPQILLNNPFPGNLQAPPGRSLGPMTAMGSDLTVNSDRRDQPAPYNQAWNVAVQREIMKDVVAEVAYIGAHGLKLPIPSVAGNQLDPRFQALGSALNSQVPNPFYGIITPAQSAVLSRTTVVQSQLLKPFPQYLAFSNLRPNAGASWYNAMQTKIQKRFGGGLSGLAHYTWSKNMDLGATGNGWAFQDSTNIQNIYNMAAEKAVSNQDIRHRFVGSGVYEIPFGRNKRFGANASPVVDAIAGGWQVNLIWTLESGRPIPLVGNNVAGLGNATQRVNIVPGQNPAFDSGTARDNVRAGKPWFNTAAFSQPAAFTFGNASRNIDALRRDGFRGIDLSVFKKFRFMERGEAEFRAEFFNLTNNVVFTNPQGNVTSTQFGIVTAAANSPRVIQFGLKIGF